MLISSSPREEQLVDVADLDGSYPRPLLRRDHWLSLDGPWQFAHDDADQGLAARWFRPDAGPDGGDVFDQRIEVPFPPESPASGVHARGPHPVVWYRRTVRHDVLSGGADADRRCLVHFGAVDHRAQVWCDGQLVVTHEGGQTPFTADVTEALTEGATEHVLVVRAEDSPSDVTQPRGKQDWRVEPHGIWYERTTGIWQTVWAESVPVLHVVDLAWTPDVAGAVVHGELSLSRQPGRPVTVEVTLRFEGDILARQTWRVTERVTTLEVSLPMLANGQERARLLWSPDSPHLIDADVVVRDEGRTGQPGPGEVVDSVAGYLGLRTVGVGGGSFRLNDAPCYLRSVLDQGYRPQTHLASRGSEELRAEVELVLAMGFNAVRVHQKVEDPRFLFWADRLGLLVWGETATAYAFSPDAITRTTTEWLEIVRRDRSHPCIVTWVPVNESWGVQDIATSQAQQQFSRSLAQLTRALDPSRPVVSNEGWEHLDSDILGLHDYTVDPDELRERYASDAAATAAVLAGHGPHGRRPILGEEQRARFLAGDAPLMITEFGGISLSDDDGAWGYGHVGSDSEYAALLGRLFDAVRAGSRVVGFCYTQLMDTGQETNGLVYADGRPKLPLATLAAIVTGAKDPAASPASTTSTSGWSDQT